MLRAMFIELQGDIHRDRGPQAPIRPVIGSGTIVPLRLFATRIQRSELFEWRQVVEVFQPKLNQKLRRGPI